MLFAQTNPHTTEAPLGVAHSEPLHRPPEINEASAERQELFTQKEFTNSWSTLLLSLFLFNQGLAREKRHYVIQAISHWLPIPQGEGPFPVA